MIESRAAVFFVVRGKSLGVGRVAAWLAVGCAVVVGMLAEAQRAGALTPTISEFSTGLNAGSSLSFGIAAGPDGDVWFADQGTTKAVGRIDPAMQKIDEFDHTDGLNGGSEPAAIAAGSDGNLWFADQGATKAIGRITPVGAINEYGPAGSNPYG